MKSQPCIVCAAGVYVTHVECGPDNGDVEALAHFGLVKPVGIAEWTVKVCNACGNVQVFRPDLVVKSPKAIPTPVP
jgi:hypothetical protein